MLRAGFLVILLAVAGCGDGQGIRAGTNGTAVDQEGAGALARIQQQAVTAGHSPYFYWGADPAAYAGYDSHSNRFVPVYARGPVSLGDYIGENSVYRDAAGLRALYGYMPENTLNRRAVYMDQTNVFDLQRDALGAGIKHIFLVVFDGMDYSLLRLAMLVRSGQWTRGGPGRVFSFQGPAWQFGFAVTSPYGETPFFNVDEQTIGAVEPSGGYNARRGGATPWDKGEAMYLNGRDGHLVTDSAASATSIMTGRKTYNGSINIGPKGKQLTTIAHLAQERGYAVGVVSSVPFDHATPAAAYAHNVARSDYQDIARDMLGLPSVAHPDKPLPGLDVVLGAGFDVERDIAAQGRNYQRGNRYLAAADLKAIRARTGGEYAVALRTAGMQGVRVLEAAVKKALQQNLRLFGMFGTRYSHLPYATANGDYEPVAGASGEAEHYSPADLRENPDLAQLTGAAIRVLASKAGGFWLLVESGDVDWAAHSNNMDNAVGAIFSGSRAVERIVQWVEAHSNWRESLLLVTADHGHLLYIANPQALRDALTR